MLLEIRDPGNNAPLQRVATGWFRSSDPVTAWETMTIDFIYGELPSSAPDYAKPRSGEMYAPSNSKPNQISVVFSSSAKGDLFTGAIGSQLDVNNFKLNY